MKHFSGHLNAGVLYILETNQWSLIMFVPFRPNRIQIGETAVQEASIGIASAVLLTWKTTEIEITRETRCLALLLVCEAIPSETARSGIGHEIE